MCDEDEFSFIGSSKDTHKLHYNVMDLFETQEMVKVCAPMVRYSKLQFRNLIKSYDCDLLFTPMILADSFCISNKARNNEFTTNQYDVPLITQFAANTVHDFAGAAYMASPFCNGVDLNCGCPQRWAKQMGLGCKMLEKPNLIYNLIKECRNAISKPFTVSVKLRLQKDLRKTVEICQQLEKCGVSFLTVHGRTPDQTTGEVNKEALKLINSSINIPLVANGNVKSLEDCLDLQEATNCKGVMVANGLLTNPTLFTGTAYTPLECIQRWLNICYNSTLEIINNHTVHTIPEKPNNLTFQCFHHHLVFMLEKILTRQEKRIFNNLQSFCDVLSFIKNKFEISPQLYSDEKFETFRPLELDYDKRNSYYLNLKPEKIDKPVDFLCDYSRDGKFFKSKTEDECDWAGMFLEND